MGKTIEQIIENIPFSDLINLCFFETEFSEDLIEFSWRRKDESIHAGKLYMNDRLIHEYIKKKVKRIYTCELPKDTENSKYKVLFLYRSKIDDYIKSTGN